MYEKEVKTAFSTDMSLFLHVCHCFSTDMCLLPPVSCWADQESPAKAGTLLISKSSSLTAAALVLVFLFFKPCTGVCPFSIFSEGLNFSTDETRKLSCLPDFFVDLTKDYGFTGDSRRSTSFEKFVTIAFSPRFRSSPLREEGNDLKGT